MTVQPRRSAQLVGRGPDRGAAGPGHVRRRAAPDAAPRAPDLVLAGGRARRPAARRGRAAGAAGRRRARRDPAVQRLPRRRPAARRGARRRAGPRRPAARGAGSAARSRGARSCAPGSPARPGAACARDDMVICPGGQAALSTAFRALGRARRHRCSSSRRPTWARSPPPAPPGCAWCRCPPTPTACAPTCSPPRSRRTGARLFYCQPLYANPHGATLAAAPPAGVLDAVARGGRVPDRGRLRPRPHASTATRRRRWPPTTRTATSSTCAR